MEDTINYYTFKTYTWISTLSCLEYLNLTKNIIDEEEDRADKFLEASTKSKLLDTLSEVIINSNASALADMESGCFEMFNNGKKEDLKLMFSLFRKEDRNLKHMSEKLRVYIEFRGVAIIENKALQTSAVEYTEALLIFQKEIDETISCSFDGHSQFQRSRDLAFQNFMNRFEYSAVFISAYCDYKMKIGFKGCSETDYEETLSKIVKLFVCLHDKDVFIKNYTRFLAKRLLENSSVSDEAEQSMIGKLKIECGHNTISKILNMYQDISLSHEIINEFKGLSHKGSPDNIQL